MHQQPNQNSLKFLKFVNRTNQRERYKKEKENAISDNQIHQFSDQAYQRFLKILNARRRKYLKQNLVEYYGKNFPITYREHFLFEQRWENKVKKEQKKQLYTNESNSLSEILVTLFTIIVYSITIWASNLDFFFSNPANPLIYYYEIYAISLLMTSIKFVRGLLEYKSEEDNGYKIITIVKSQYRQIISFAYFVLKLCKTDQSANIFIFIEISVLFLLYLQASKMYQGLRIDNFSLKYQYQIKVLDMAISVFIIAHFISIVLFLTTQICPQNNWMTPLNIDRSNPFALYAYSFYFCTTTIMTVGYGDIAPKNVYQVIVVILVQIFGVIVLGYIINQIGYCVSSLRMGQQLLQKDLAVVEKMRRHYRMDKDLAHKVRQYVVNSKHDVLQLSPDEEQTITNKLNQEIRLDLTTKNMLSVVKSSIFFLCRWSKHFQSVVSLKLIHSLFNPNDVLYQPLGNERIYIIKRGRIQIYAGKRLQKVLKTIDSQADKQVSDNSYGITGVVSARKPKVYAVSKGFTSAYYIDGQKFRDCALEKAADFQFYHQLKARMDQAVQCECVEISSLVSTKHHYNPTRSFVIRRNSKKSKTQSRKYIIRQDKNMFRGNKLFSDQNTLQQIKHKFAGSFATFDDQQAHKIKFTMNTVNTMIKDFVLPIMEDTNNVYSFLDHHFEASKEYSNFFARNNQSEILKAFEQQQFVKS